MDDLADLFLKPVEGKDDVFAFRFDFLPEGKSVDGATADVVTELDDGDLLIEGWAARFDGIDRQNENFAPGAFQRGIKTFLNGQAGLCYQHDHSKVLGKVLELEEEEGKGLRLKARVDGAIRQHPELGTLYNQIKKGTINGLSVGGFFRRGMTELGKRITDMDFTEISTTAVPVHPGTSFGVIAGKALQMGESQTVEPAPVADDADLAAAAGLLERFDTLFTSLGEAKALPETQDPEEAAIIANMIRCTAQLREEATVMAAATAGDPEDSDVLKLVDSIETQTSAWEASLLKLGAEVGPLPAPLTY